MGGKNPRNNFSRNMNSATKKVGKKIVGKMFEKAFLYSHEYSTKKMGGEKPAKQFFQKHTNIATKKVG